MLSSYAYDSPIKPSTLHITSVCSLELQLWFVKPLCGQSLFSYPAASIGTMLHSRRVLYQRVYKLSWTSSVPCCCTCTKLIIRFIISANTICVMIVIKKVGRSCYTTGNILSKWLILLNHGMDWFSVRTSLHHSPERTLCPVSWIVYNVKPIDSDTMHMAIVSYSTQLSMGQRLTLVLIKQTVSPGLEYSESIVHASTTHVVYKVQQMVGRSVISQTWPLVPSVKEKGKEQGVIWT